MIYILFVLLGMILMLAILEIMIRITEHYQRKDLERYRKR
jgi:hypothetical protein